MSDAQLYDLNIDAFIKEVQKYPEIWNTMSESYNDRVKKRNAWIEISAAVCENFHQKNIWERNDIGKILNKKWRNIKDNYIKSLRKRDRSRPIKEYMYSQQLSFLQSTVTAAASANCYNDLDDQMLSADSIKSEDNDDQDHSDPLVNDVMKMGAVVGNGGNGEAMEGHQTGCDTSSDLDYILPNPDSRRRRKRQNSYDSKISQSAKSTKSTINLFEPNVDVLDDPKVDVTAFGKPGSQSSNGDRSFFESLLSALKDFNEDEKLEFRSKVLDLVRNMRKKKMIKEKIGTDDKDF